MAGDLIRKRNKLNPTTQNSSNVDEEKKDRLSSLPDYLILHILSFLCICSFKEVVKTSLLSKRWQFLWTEMSELDFSQLNPNRDLKKCFAEHVGRILAMSRGCYLKRFRVIFGYEKCFASNVNFWVHLLVKNKVKDITLSLKMWGFNYVYVLPQELYTHSSLTSLIIDGCKIDPQAVIEWGSLKHLCIKYVDLTNCLMEKILSSCPVLEVLKICNVTGLTCIKINSPILSTLKIIIPSKSYNHVESKHVVEISAPHLQILEIREYGGGKRFRLRNISSLARAKIYIVGYKDRDIYASRPSPDTMSYMKELLLSLHSVENLELGTWCTEVLSSLELKDWKLPTSNRLCLTIRARVDEEYFPGILNILTSSPYLKTLVIRGIFLPSKKECLTRDLVAAYLQNSNLDFVMFHLETIEIAWLNEEFYLSEAMLILVEFLLKSSKVLEKMVIHGHNGIWVPSSDSTLFNKFISRVQAFPKASTKAVVQVLKV